MSTGGLAYTVTGIERKRNQIVDKASKKALFVLFAGATLLASTSDTGEQVVILGHNSMPSYVSYVENQSYNGTVCMSQVVDALKCANLDKIKSMASFAEDWNGNGARAFSKKAIDVFEKIISVLSIQPQIAPTGRNSLLMQYELEDNSMLAFEVSEDKTEKVCVPQGKYELATIELITENIEMNIEKSVVEFYGRKVHL